LKEDNFNQYSSSMMCEYVTQVFSSHHELI
jgi:hypothetical protein